MSTITENRNRIIEKVKKILALANSATGHEAETAAVMASKLLAEYNLTMDDVTVDDFIAETTADEHSIDLLPGKCGKWEMVLASFIMNIYEVEGVRSKRMSSLGQPVYRMSFIGVDPALSVASQTFVTVYRYLIMKSMPVRYNAKKIEEYRQGFIMGLYQKLREEKERARQAAATMTTEIALATKDLVDSYMKEKYPRLRKERAYKADTTSEAFIKGMEAGQKYNVTPGVRTGDTAKSVNA